MSEVTSRPYKPDAEMCCEACVFGRGQHSPACSLIVEVIDIWGQKHTFAGFSDEVTELQIAGGMLTPRTSRLLHSEVARAQRNFDAMLRTDPEVCPTCGPSTAETVASELPLVLPSMGPPSIDQ